MTLKKSTSDSAKTLIVIITGLILFYLITNSRWLIILSFIIGIIGVFSKFLSDLIHLLWMKFSVILGLIIPNIILTLVFFFILTPTAWLSKVFRSQNQLNIKNKKNSLFKNRAHLIEKSSFEKPW